MNQEQPLLFDCDAASVKTKMVFLTAVSSKVLAYFLKNENSTGRDELGAS